MKHKQIFLILNLLLLIATSCSPKNSLSSLQKEGVDINSSLFFEFQGFSMSPTIPNGVVLVIDQDAYNLKLPQRGDIVLYTASLNPERLYVHRIIGLPGENIVINTQGVIINGETLYEPYVQNQANYNGEWTVGNGEYFILGDDRPQSADSHLWGPITLSNIRGKAILICNSQQLGDCVDLYTDMTK